jgi:hypothetical protein
MVICVEVWENMGSVTGNLLRNNRPRDVMSFSPFEDNVLPPGWKGKPRNKQQGLVFTGLAYSSTLKMEVVLSSET